LVFAWKNATMIRARKSTKADGTKVYQIWGPLFFGSVQNFNAKFDPAGDPESIEIDFIESKVSDHSGMEAIKTIAEKYEALGKKIKLTHLSPDCKTLLLKGNESFGQMIEESVEDPRYYVVTSTLDKEV
jgi:SulP family sulfate permease